MSRVGGIRTTPRRPERRGPSVLAAACAAVALPAVAAESALGASTPPLLFALALAAAALVVGVLLAWRVLRSRQRLVESLREARARSGCLEPLLDLWLWRSGPEHRLDSIRPPPGTRRSRRPGCGNTSPPTTRPRCAPG